MVHYHPYVRHMMCFCRVGVQSICAKHHSFCTVHPHPSYAETASISCCCLLQTCIAYLADLGFHDDILLSCNIYQHLAVGVVITRYYYLSQTTYNFSRIAFACYNNYGCFFPLNLGECHLSTRDESMRTPHLSFSRPMSKRHTILHTNMFFWHCLLRTENPAKYLVDSGCQD